MGNDLEISKEEALWKLAARLYATMERLDPTPEAEAWDTLSEWDRAFYYQCVRELAKERGLLQASWR